MVGAGVGVVRALRALVFLAVTVALTTAGHVVGGGTVSVGGVTALVVVAWPVALLGSSRQRGIRHLFPALGAVQLAGHALLGFLSGSGGSAGLGCSAPLGHHGHRALECGEPLVGVVSGSAHSPAMTGAHLLAALALALVLAKGEALLWRVLDLVVPALPRVARGLDRVVRPTFLLRGTPRGARPLVVLGRGPPVAA